MSNIDKEIEQMAESMEKSTQSVQDLIKNLGPDGIRTILPTLNAEEKQALINELQEMKKAKAVSMDKDYAPKPRYGKLDETVIEESEVDDDKDEKLVKEEASEIDHQGDSTPEGIEGQVIKSILNDIQDISEINDSDLSDLAKSFENDLDQMSDYLTTDDETLLEKARVVTRMGIRYYADGKNAGKKVGSVRGDKASINSIERARKKGKISDKAAKRGIKVANQEKVRADIREKNPERDYSNSFQGIMNRAIDKIDSEKRRKDVNEQVKNQMKYAEKELADLTAAREQGKKKKDGGYTKNAVKDISEKKQAFSQKNFDYEKEIGSKKRTESVERRKKEEAALREKRASMKKSIEELNNDEEMQKSFVQGALDSGKTFEQIVKACETKGISIEKITKAHEMIKMPKKEAIKEHEQLVEVLESEDKKDDKKEAKKQAKELKEMKKSLEQEIFEDFSKSWKDENQLLKAKTGGRNHHFSVNDYYNQVLAESEKPEVEQIKKSEKEDLQDLIEKSKDKSWDQINEEKQLSDNAKKLGKFSKSFTDEDMESLFSKKQD